jgi:hypothetical protein
MRQVVPNRDAPGLAIEVLHRDIALLQLGAPARITWVVGRHRLVEVELSLLYQPHDHRRGKRLGQRRDRIGCIWHRLGSPDDIDDAKPA